MIEIIQELTDEDVGAGGDDMDEEDEEDAEKAAQARMAMAEFIDELVGKTVDKPKLTCQLNNSILDLLVANLGRLDESEDSDSRGVYNILGVFENLLSFIPPLADQIISETTLLPWLLKRVDKKEFDSNKQYASQILAILLQQSRENVLKLGELDGMEVILKSLSVSRNIRQLNHD